MPRQIDFARLVLALVLSLCALPALASRITAHGRVTDFLTGQPIVDGYVLLVVDDYVFSAAVLDDGTYSVTADAELAPSSTVYVEAKAMDHVSATQAIDPTQSDVQADFALHRRIVVSGVVHYNPPSENAVSVVALKRVDENWVMAGHAFAPPDETFQISGLEPGEYRFCAGFLGGMFARHCYDNVEISSVSDIDAASPVVLSEDEMRTGMNFQLPRGGVVSGTLIDRRSGNPIGNIRVTIALHDAGGRPLETLATFTDAQGAYRVDGVPNGTFYATATVASYGFRATELYDGIECPQGVCASIMSGRPIVIAEHASVNGVDFSFQPIATVRGIVVDRDTGMSISGVDIYACTHGWISRECFGVQSDADGRYELGLDSRGYSIVALANDDHVSQFYPDTNCLDLWCTSSSDLAISAEEGHHYEGFDFALYKSSYISGTITDGVTGDPIEYAAIAMFDSDYRFVFSFYSGAGGEYVTPKWAGGTYYIASYFRWNFRCTFYLDHPCSESATDPNQIAAIAPTPIILADGDTVTGIDLRLPADELLFKDGFDPSSARGPTSFASGAGGMR